MKKVPNSCFHPCQLSWTHLCVLVQVPSWTVPESKCVTGGGASTGAMPMPSTRLSCQYHDALPTLPIALYRTFHAFFAAIYLHCQSSPQHIHTAEANCFQTFIATFSGVCSFKLNTKNGTPRNQHRMEKIIWNTLDRWIYLRVSPLIYTP